MFDDASIARFAARQHDVVGIRQCLAAGMTRRQAEHRVAAGAWRRVLPGVFATGHAPLTHAGRCHAALLFAGDDAVISHRTAASLWRLQPEHAGPVHVTTPRKLRARADVRLHWTRHPPQARRRGGLRVTSLERTLVDLADLATAAELEEAIRSAERMHGFDRERLRPIAGRRGTRRLTTPHQLTRGDLEPLLRRLLHEAGFAPPEWNAPFGPYDLDAVWWDARIVIEVDDWDTHRHRTAFEADRRRDRALAAAGLTPVRVTHADLTDGRKALVHDLRALGAPAR